MWVLGPVSPLLDFSAVPWQLTLKCSCLFWFIFVKEKANARYIYSAILSVDCLLNTYNMLNTIQLFELYDETQTLFSWLIQFVWRDKHIRQQRMIREGMSESTIEFSGRKGSEPFRCLTEKHLLIFIFSFIHMFIQCLGHFFPLPPTPSLTLLPLPLPSYTLATRQKLFCPYL
jgi:hypothetical protein